MSLWCCDEQRREVVRPGPFNGIDYLEVVDRDAALPADRQRFLRLRFVNTGNLAGLGRDNLRIDGGERIRGLRVLDVTLGVGDEADLLTVEVDQPGDFSIYTLRLVAGPQDAQAPSGFDPRLSAIDFSFKVECPSDFDCAERSACTEAPVAVPALDYRAKDYERFRRLMLERLSLLVPGWTERSPADAGVTLVELLAFVADQLSYRQDAITTEAYLDTARRRVSVKRHARLVDYRTHDGVNARAWLHVAVAADLAGAPLLAAGTPACTRLPKLSEPVLPALPAGASPVVFQTLHPVAALWAAHNQMALYTWSDRDCCLAVGSTTTTLAGHFPNLAPGDVLLLEEVLGPRTGNAADADPAHRHAVRLRTVQHSRRLADDSLVPLTDPVTGVEITEIAWDTADALPFPLCLSATLRNGESIVELEQVSVARGNMLLADHGRTLPAEALGAVPAPRLFAPALSAGGCSHADSLPLPARYRPRLASAGLVFASRYDASLPATHSLVGDPRGALPALALRSTLPGAGPDAPADTWTPQTDLLRSRAADRHFVVDVDNDGETRLRFGDDRYGLRPQTGEAFTAVYRVGSGGAAGAAGNVGADSLVHLISDLPGVLAVRNPLPASGGVDGERMEQVRRRAPAAFRVQERAVTEADYAAVAKRHPALQRAAATSRWTGSWHTLFITADRLGGVDVDPGFETELVDHIEPFRMAGHDLEVDGPRPVALDLALQVCVLPDYARADVRGALLALFNPGRSRDGRLGLFHPDRYSFGQPVYLAPLIAAAQAVDGVASVRATRFQRLGQPHTAALTTGVLTLARLEVARLDNDPNFAERGRLTLDIGGGR